jgi:hypothetical protein
MKEVANMKYAVFLKITFAEWLACFREKPTMFSKLGMLFWFLRWWIRMTLT